MRLANMKAGRKGNLNVATEVYGPNFCYFFGNVGHYLSYYCIKSSHCKSGISSGTFPSHG